MNLEEKKWYLAMLERELDKLNDQFHGEISFAFRFVAGKVVNVVIELQKSCKMPHEPLDIK